MKSKLFLDKGVLLGPILMDQDRLIQAERKHLHLKVNNLSPILQIQVPVEGQDIHLIVKLVLTTIRELVTCSRL